MNRPIQGFPPILDKRGAPRVRRFDEQRWLIDNIIRANGIDWDQPRSRYLAAPCGVEAGADFAAIQSTSAGPLAIQFSMVKCRPIIGASY